MGRKTANSKPKPKKKITRRKIGKRPKGEEITSQDDLTFQQRRILRIKAEQHRPAKRQESMNEEMPKVTLDDLQSMKTTCVEYLDSLQHMILKNKINASNAFRVSIPQIKDLNIQKGEDEHDYWKQAASVLQSGAHVYGYKVDSFLKAAESLKADLRRADMYINHLQIAQPYFEAQIQRFKIFDQDKVLKKHLQKKKIKQCKELTMVEEPTISTFIDVKKMSFSQGMCNKNLLLNKLGIQKDLGLNVHERPLQMPSLNPPNNLIHPICNLNDRMHQHQMTFSYKLQSLHLDVSQMVQMKLGKKNKMPYSREDIDWQRHHQHIHQPHLPLVINPGHQAWDQSNSHPHRNLMESQMSALTPQTQFKIQEEFRTFRDRLNYLGNGSIHIPMSWLKKQEIDQQNRQRKKHKFLIELDQNQKTNRRQVLKMLPGGHRPFRQEELGDDKHRFIPDYEGAELDFLKLFTRENSIQDEHKLRKKLMRGQNKQYSQLNVRPMKEVRQRFKELKSFGQGNARTTEVQNGYREFTMRQHMSVSRFFVHYLHFKNDQKNSCS